MNNEELLLSEENSATSKLRSLDDVMARVIETIDIGRNEIFLIAEECHHQLEEMLREQEEIVAEKAQLVIDLKNCESQEINTRIHLMEVSKDFSIYTEDDIKNAYESARLVQISLLDLKQRDVYLRRREDELTQQIAIIKNITERAKHLITYTNIAIKLLQGNIDRLSDAIDSVDRKHQIEMWIIESQEAERRKIARDLHDGPAQNLAGLLIRLDLIKQLNNDSNFDLIAELNKVKSIGQECLTDVRRLMFDLKPTLLHEEGLISTLRDYFATYEDKYNFAIDLVVLSYIKKLDLSLEIALFRIVQEAITNARKHSGVSEAMVKLEVQGNILTLVIKDDGGGFELKDSDKPKESYGIIGMKERVELFGGIIDIISSPGKGTQVIVKVPLEGEAIHGKH